MNVSYDLPLRSESFWLLICSLQLVHEQQDPRFRCNKNPNALFKSIGCLRTLSEFSEPIRSSNGSVPIALTVRFKTKMATKMTKSRLKGLDNGMLTAI